MRPLTRHRRGLIAIASLCLVWLAGSGWVDAVWGNRRAHGDEATAAAEMHHGADGAPTRAGNDLMVAAISSLEQRSALFARVTHESHLFGIDLVGAGSYVQYVDGDVRKFRLELKTQVTGETGSLLHVSDGRYLWTDLDLPGQRVVRRLDLRTLGAAAVVPSDGEDLAGQPRPVSRVQPNLGQHAGGIAKLLASLSETFALGIPENASISGTPVYLMRGHHRAAGRSSSTAKDGSLTGHVPQEVVVAMGRQDLFPRLIEYYGAGAKSNARSRELLLRMRWSDVQWEPIVDTGQFEYVPPNDWEDFTESYLTQLSRLAE